MARAAGAGGTEQGMLMTTFDKRKDEAEARFKHDQEFKFKATARRNKLLGLWAAEQMGVGGASAETYAKAVVVADFERTGDEDVVDKLVRDFAEAGVAIDAHRVRKEMARLMAVALEQLKEE